MQDATTGEISLAVADDFDTVKRLAGVVSQAGPHTGGDEVEVQFGGELADALSGFSRGDRLFVTTTGTTGNTLSATPPSTDNHVHLCIGHVVNSTDLFINIDKPIEV